MSLLEHGVMHVLLRHLICTPRMVNLSEDMCARAVPLIIQGLNLGPKVEPDSWSMILRRSCLLEGGESISKRHWDG